MMSLWEQVRDGDDGAVRRALREADLIWKRGEDLHDAVIWVERAAAFAQQQGDDARAMELANWAVELGREVKRRSGMPARSSPAWEEARRIQSSLIEVQDSWLIPVDVEVEQDSASSSAVLPADADTGSIDVEWDLQPEGDAGEAPPGLESPARQQEVLTLELEDQWFDEAPTLPRTIPPPSARQTVPRPHGSPNDLMVLIERARGPEVVVAPTIAERDALGVARAALRACPELEDTSGDIIDALLEAASTVHLNEHAALVGWDAGVVTTGEVALLRHGLVSHRIDAGESFSCSGSIAGTVMHMGASLPVTSVIAWERATLEAVLGTSPWVLESLRARADYLSTLAVISLGAVVQYMGEDVVRALLGASKVVVVPPGAVLFEASMEVHALNIVGAGEITLGGPAGVRTRAEPGQILFADELVSGAPAPETAAAGERGATLLHVEAVELMHFLPHVPLLARALSG